MKSHDAFFSKDRLNWEQGEREAGRPRSPQPPIQPRPTYQLQGVQSGDPNVDAPLHPTRDGQRHVIIESVQPTIQGRIFHVARADQPMGRTYPVTERYLPPEAIKR